MERINFMKNFPVLLAGVGIGAAIVATAMPSPPEKEQCSVYKVQPKAVTAYVLKPPKCEPILINTPQVCPLPPPQEEEIPRKKLRKHRR